MKFSKRESAMRGITKIMDYITSSPPMTFDHSLGTMNEDVMLGFLMAEVMFLLRFMKSCTYSPNINYIKAMHHLNKMNDGLITILKEHFKNTIWCSAGTYMTQVYNIEVPQHLCPYNVDFVSVLVLLIDTATWCNYVLTYCQPCSDAVLD